MMRPAAWPTSVAIALWIVGEVLRGATTPKTLLWLSDALAAIVAGPPAWPCLQGWGLGTAVLVQEAATRQRRSDACGAAALQEVLQAHGLHLRQDLLWSMTRLPSGGTSAPRLAHIGSHLGLDCSVRRLAGTASAATPLFPPTMPLPAIVHLRRGHFVVLHRCSALRARLLDPACGTVRVRTDALRRQTSGIVITCAAPQPATGPPARPLPAPSAAGATP